MMRFDLAGQQFGEYRLLRLIGEGGFASVYLGEYLHPRRMQVAVKVLRARLTEEERAAFLQEVRLVARLVHPHIVRVLGGGVVDGVPYLAMDYAPGGSLRQRYPRGTQVPLETVVGYVRQVAAGLQYAHDRRVIHRDVKPANLLLGARDEVMLGDFGVALVVQNTLSQSMKEAVGTLSYVAPEQIQGQPQRASDQYALAAVVYEWLSGRPPFQGAPVEVLAQHLAAAPAPLRPAVALVSPAVEGVVLRALAKDPEQRFPSVRAFAEALEAASRPDGPQAVPLWALPQSLRVATSRAPGTLIRLLEGGVGAVQALAWSPDGEALAVAGTEARVRVVQASSGAEVCAFTGHTDTVFAVGWSPDGTRLASAGADATVQVWEARTGQRVLSYEKHGDYVRAVGWSPDGRYIVSASDDTTVQVWEARTGQRVLSYEKHGDYVRAVGWSPDGRWIASASDDGTVQVWGALDGAGQGWFRGELGKITALAWAPMCGVLALGGDDGLVRVWEVDVQRLRFAEPGHVGAVSGLAWSPDGERLASAAQDGAVHLWEAHSGQRLLTYRGASSGEAWLLAQQARAWWGSRARGGGSSTGGRRAVDTQSTDDLEEEAVEEAEEESDEEEDEALQEAVLVLAWAPDGRRLACGGGDGTIHLWQT